MVTVVGTEVAQEVSSTKQLRRARSMCHFSIVKAISTRQAKTPSVGPDPIHAKLQAVGFALSELRTGISLIVRRIYKYYKYNGSTRSHRTVG